MARKRLKIKISPSAIKIFIVPLLVFGISFGIFQGILYWASHSEYFRIKAVVIDPALQFINLRDVNYLIGDNIFAVNLERLERKVANKYPQVSDLKVTKKFPDRIYFEASKRNPLLQVLLSGRILTLDENGILLSTITKKDERLPLVEGLKSSDKTIRLGYYMGGKDLKAVINLVKEFNQTNSAQICRINTVNVSNISKIEMVLSNKLTIIVDKDDIKRRMKILSFLLNQGQINLEETKYIDLRFKEPILGKK